MGTGWAATRFLGGWLRIRRARWRTPALVICAAAILAPSADPVRAMGTVTAAVAGPASAAVPASSQGLHVIPFPGTPDASPVSNVIFSALRPSEIETVLVTGSSSGVHIGHLTALPDHAGTAFVPDTRFTTGERVSVSVTLTSAEAGTASGDPGSSRLSFSFTIAVPPERRPLGSHPPPTARAAATSACTGCQRFHSIAGLNPPAIKATADPDTRSGDIFLTVRRRNGGGQQGPMILNPRGQLVWFDPLGSSPNGSDALNLQVQRYQGQPVLTFWSAGRNVIMNRHYQTVATVHAGDGYGTDDHDFQITPRGTAFVETYVPVKVSLSSLGIHSSRVVWDCVVQEVDIKTGRVLWEWHALGHVPLTASYVPYAGSFEYFHLNSLQQLPNGNLLISSRYTWGVYEIDEQTGKLVWTLGGKYSNFKVGAGAHFSWQHDARLSGNMLTLFDDGANGAHQQQSQSSAKVLRLNFAARTATLVHTYRHYPPLLAGSQGSAQILPNADMLVGWGNQPDFTEYGPGGRQIFNGSLPVGVESYRAYRFPWIGQPLTKPAVALVPRSDGSVRVYASWNGATQVASWRVLGGASSRSLSALETVPRSGFETAMTLRSRPPYVAVQALSSQGHTLGTSLVHADQ